MKRLVLILALWCCTCTAWAQEDSVNRKRLLALEIGAGAAYVGTMLMLNEFWYKDYPRSSFHFFNDNNGWLGMDKAGHIYTSYGLGKWSMETLRWTGMSRKKAAWRAGWSGTFFLTTIEILDGFSSEWGFSLGDMGANLAGSALFVGQEAGWGEQRILVKYGWWPVDYSQYSWYDNSREFKGQLPPQTALELYGSNFAERLITVHRVYQDGLIWLLDLGLMDWQGLRI
jgi:hypothetical protein